MTAPAAGLLLSEAAEARLGARLAALAHAAGVPLRCHTPATAPDALPDLRAAFFSRDLYEGSELHRPGPLSDAFFRLVDAAPGLRWLHVFSSGLDLPQYAASLARGVRVTGSSGVTAVSIAQTVLAAVLAQSRGFAHWLPAQARREWAPLTGTARPKEIDTQHAVVVGAGPIGREIGRLLGAVGFRTTAVRRSATPAEGFGRTIELARLDELLPQCDWLVLAVPLTAHTRGLLDARRLALLPPHARVVNVARGGLVDEAALVRALREGRLAGAYLDTFAQEPLPPDSPLWTLPGVWISPHNSAAAQGHEQRLDDSFLREFQAWLAQYRERSPG